MLTAIDLNQNNTIDLTGPDRITFTTNDVYYDSANAANVNRTRTYVWEGSTSSASNLISTLELSVDGLNSWGTQWNGSTAITSKNHTVYGSGGNRYVTATAADGWYLHQSPFFLSPVGVCGSQPGQWIATEIHQLRI